MNELNVFCESVFYESIGLKELLDLDMALERIIEFRSHLLERTIEDDERLVNGFIDDAQEQARKLRLNHPDKVKEKNFNVLEHKIFDIIEKLESMRSENSANNNRYANLIAQTEAAINQFLQHLGADFVASNFSTTHCFVNDRGKEIPVEQRHFDLRFYKSAYKHYLKQKRKELDAAAS